MTPLSRRTVQAWLVLLGALSATGAQAQQGPLKIGLILPMTGAFSSTGRQIDAAVKLYLAQQGHSVAGRPVEVVLKDDAGVADTTRRLAQELIVNDKVVALAGFGLTPLAMAAGQVATQGKTPMVVMAAATSAITDRTPYAVRTSMTLPQVTMPIAEWASKNDIKRVVTLVSDYGPGLDAEKAFKERFALNGGQTLATLRVPVTSTDFSPFLQRARDLQPDALFVFVPSGVGAPLMKQYAERGLDKAGIRLIGTGDVVDDDILNDMGDAALGLVTSHHYSAAHDSPANRKFVEAFRKANNGMRPNYMAVGGYDGMRLLFAGLKATQGAGGEALLNAMKGQVFESPRGTVLIDAQTREPVQDVYIRKVERRNGELYNVEFATYKAVKDPYKTAK